MSSKSSPKFLPDFSLEEAENGAVCGIDEAGRGPLAGPVVASCVYVPPESRSEAFWRNVNDSKLLPKPKRAHLAECIRSVCAYGIASASVAEIDVMNIFQASLLAMRRACLAMSQNFSVVTDLALVDGKFTPHDMPCAALAVVKGDGRSLSIAAASILAKTARDALMADLAREHPGYGWERNAGYSAPEHLRALETLGLTAHHRRSFAPVRAVIDKRRLHRIMS